MIENVKKVIVELGIGAAIEIAKFGHIPEHVAVIMDGNRRYAKNKGLPASQGHVSGRNMMEKILEFIRILGVKEITFFIFSIENDKRSQEEKDFLVDLGENGLRTHRLLNIEYAKQLGIRYEIIGDWKQFPERLKPLLANLMIGTRNNTGLKVNAAYYYTARDALERSVSSIIHGLQKGVLETGDINDSLLQEASVLHPIRKVDWLVRTSGETRLSDFLLLESSHAMLSFYPESFPELSFWKILQGFQEYQKFAREKAKRILSDSNKNYEKAEIRRAKFLQEVREKKWAVLKKMVHANDHNKQ